MLSSIADSDHDTITYDSTAIGKNDSSYNRVRDQTSISKTMRNKRNAVLLIVAIGFVWPVLSIPIIIFHLPDEFFKSSMYTNCVFIFSFYLYRSQKTESW